LIFFFASPVLSGKFGKQSLRFRAAKTFFLALLSFLYQNKNPVVHLSHGDNFVLETIYYWCNERLITKTEESKPSDTLGCVGRKNSKTNIGIHGHVGGTRPGQTCKTPKNLCTCVSEEGPGGWGRGGCELRNAILLDARKAAAWSSTLARDRTC
jgi:hypothetical protein